MAPAPDGPNRLAFLDAARGTAALWVVGVHALQVTAPGSPLLPVGILIGYGAVLMFFMVSGFVVPLSLQRGEALGTFWRRRCFRLFPVYWFSLALAFVYVLTGGTGLGVRLSDSGTWATNLAVVQGYFKRPHVLGVYWTLPFEIVIYIVCSVLFLAGILNRIGARTVALVLGTLVFLCARDLIWVGKPASLEGMRQTVVLGCLFGLLGAKHVAGAVSGRALAALLLALAVAVVGLWGASRALYPAQSPLVQLGRLVCSWGTAYGLFFALLALRHRVQPGPLCWLGRRSYPLYLLHPLVLLVVPASWGPWVGLPAIFVGSLLLADLAHRFVERPGIALGRRLERRAAAPPAPEPQLQPLPLPARRAA